MKNLLIILFTLFTMCGFCQEVNKTDAKGFKQGLWEKYHPNGMIRYKGNFKDNQPIGEFNYFYDNGKLQVKMTYTGSNSYANVYYETGEIKAVGKYEKQEKDSVWKYYDKEGYKISEEFYLSGKKEGTWKSYYNTGQVVEEKEYSNDFENGIWKQYYANGKEKMTATYVGGELEGRATYYNNNGLKAVSGVFIRGARDGFWTFYKKDGKTVRKKEEYKNGVRIDKNKDDDVIDPDGVEHISEDILEPDNFMSPQ